MKRAILDALSTTIAVLDRDGVIIAVNEPWRRFALENSPEPGKPARRTEIGVNYLEVLKAAAEQSADGVSEAAEGIPAVLAGKIPSFSIEYPCHSPQQHRWFSMKVTPLGPELEGVVVEHTDITERKKAQYELASLRADMKRILQWQIATHTVAALAHEVNQPLSSISALAEAASRLLGATDAAEFASTATGARLEQILDRIAAESERAGGVVRNLMTSLGAPDTSVEAIDFPGLLREVVRVARASGHEDCEILFDGAHGVPPLWGNRLQVEKVLLNLISNAADAMREADAPNGRIWISIAVAAPGREAIISVRDEGPGISAGMEQQMFHPFISSKGTGLGMGLTICRTLVEAQGGRLWHEPHHGGGATFRFTLPLASPPQ
jgi:C4-dicarboxylate-specific signal transduction histidine kinase